MKVTIRLSLLMNFFAIAVAFCPCIFSAQDTTVAPDPARPMRIAHIFYNGNNTSIPRAIRMVLELDTGMIYDSAQVNGARKKLQYIDMFSKVRITPSMQSNGVDLYVSVKEPFYLTFGGNIDYYNYRYGERGLWCAPRLGYEDANFRGRFEDLKFIFRFSGLQANSDSWDDFFSRSSLRWLQWQTGYLSWTKPLLPTHYFLWTSFLYDQKPDEQLYLNKTELSGRLALGKRLQDHSKITVSIIPDLQRKTLLRSNRDTARVFQTFGALAYSIDRKIPFFDPDHGWYLSTELRSNYLFAEGLNPYVQYTLDARYYHRGIFTGQKFGFKAMMVLRNADAGYFNRLFLGGNLTLRGYNQNEIGLAAPANDLFMASGEYRFAICHLPAIHYVAPRFAAKVVSYSTEFNFRLDGALLADYGVVSANLNDLTNQNGPSRQSGTGIGFSLRLLEIPLQGRLNFDVVWIDRPSTKALDFYPFPALNVNTDVGF